MNYYALIGAAYSRREAERVADLIDPLCPERHPIWPSVQCTRAPVPYHEHQGKHPDKRIGDVRWPWLDDVELTP